MCMQDMTLFSVVALDKRMLYCISAATIRKLLEALLKKKMNARDKGKYEREYGMKFQNKNFPSNFNGLLQVV